MSNNGHLKKQALFTRRKNRVRSKVSGTATRPRMCVTRSIRHVYVQLIDDTAHTTLVGFSDTALSGSSHAPEGMTRLQAVAYNVGYALGERAKEKGITHIVFDRNGRKYHGRVKAVADGARAAGLEF